MYVQETEENQLLNVISKEKDDESDEDPPDTTPYEHMMVTSTKHQHPWVRKSLHRRLEFIDGVKN